MERIKAVFNWSGGKDSAHALLRAQQSGEYEIVALLTTVNRDTHRSTMHGIPTALLQMQAESIGVPLYIVDLTPKGNMEDYDVAMSRAVEHFKTQGVTRFIFGDIFLHDVRKYREQQLSPHGIEIVEPLWGKSSEEVMNDFLVSGFRTVVVTTMADGLGADAGGDYIYKKNTSNRSLPIDLEEAYMLTAQADMWLNAGSAASLGELKSQFPKFANTRCVRNGAVYNCNKRLNAAGGNDYWESGVVRPDVVLHDLIAIMHPEALDENDRELHYYQRLE